MSYHTEIPGLASKHLDKSNRTLSDYHRTFLRTPDTLQWTPVDVRRNAFGFLSDCYRTIIEVRRILGDLIIYLGVWLAFEWTQTAFYQSFPRNSEKNWRFNKYLNLLTELSIVTDLVEAFLKSYETATVAIIKM